MDKINSYFLSYIRERQLHSLLAFGAAHLAQCETFAAEILQQPRKCREPKLVYSSSGKCVGN